MNGNLMVLSCPTNHYASLYMKHHCVYRKLKSLAYFRKNINKSGVCGLDWRDSVPLSTYSSNMATCVHSSHAVVGHD